MEQNGGILRMVVIMAAVIVVIGLIIIGSQYWSDLTTGAGAALIEDIEVLPEQITISKDTFSQMVGLTEEYFEHTDMATRSILIRELQEVLVSLI